MKKQIFTIILLTIVSMSVFGQSFKLDATGANDMRLRTNNLDRMNILPNGNVGIGTITPDAKLDVNGDLILAPYTYSPVANFTGDPFSRSFKSYMSLNPPTGVTTTIKGIDGGTVDRYGLMLFLTCGGAGTVILKHNNSTLPANKINTNTGADITITGRGGATLVYDTDGWRVVSYDNGGASTSAVIDRISTPDRIALLNQNLGKMVFDTDKGRLYVWDGDGWKALKQEESTLDQILTVKKGASDGLATDEFGYAVAIKGDWAVIGAPGADSDEGEAYIFKHGVDGWKEVKRLRQDITAANTAITAGSNFGNSVDIEVITVGGVDYPVVVVGAEAQASGAGRAYIFRFKSVSGVLDWYFEQALAHPNPSNLDNYGRSVSISGDRIAVGAPFDDVNTNSGVVVDAGSVCTFKATFTGSYPAITVSYLIDQVTPGEPSRVDVSPATDERFGYAVDIDATRMAVGSPYTDTNDYGKVSLFSITGVSWTFLRAFDQTNLSGTIETNSHIGWSVSLSGQNLLIGVPDDDVNGDSNVGTAQFIHSQTTWTASSQIDPPVKLFHPLAEVSNPNTVGAQWGRSVSINGNYMIIGGPFHPFPDTGSGYTGIYKYTGGVLDPVNDLIKVKIIEASTTTGYYKGQAVGISSSGDFMVGEARDTSGWVGKVHFGNATAY
jgi:FG-GAP repeat